MMHAITPEDQRLLADATQLLEVHYARKISVATQQRYRREGVKYFHALDLIERTTRKATFYHRKAALEFYAAEELIDAVRDNAIERVRYAVDVLRLMSSKFSDENTIGDMRTCPIVQSGRKNSKRRSLDGLPDNWRELFLSDVQGQKRDWILLLAAAGLRPAEIALGVFVEPHSRGVVIKVHGAKVTEKSGQTVREIYVENVFATELAHAGPRMITAASANLISQYICRRSKGIFGRKTNSVSAYSFRHQFAADVKASELSSLEMSAVLGHSAEFTKKHYGHRNQARAKGKILLRSASSLVRPMSRTGKIPTVQGSRKNPGIEV